MAPRKKKLDPAATVNAQEPPGTRPRAEFRVYGEEMIEKEVRPSGKTGRIYLPPDWVGKHVKIIRID
ncbi:DUF2080 family transposase-associated protein [Desulfosarcina alkanivorans]|jgi:putative transposon-encoded protein|nr:DUF2080 family transposase-associated protein [Desulfosarcina alkanivorans]